MNLLVLLMATILLDFDDAADAATWSPVNDVVMGGVSHSAFSSAGPGIARFSGVVSLENSGGFASVHSPPRAWDTAGATAFVLRVRGDGKQYKLTLRTGAGFAGTQYQARFQPSPGEWTDVRLPVESFVATFRGRKMQFAPRLDPADVRELGLMISDKQAGPFELLLDRVGIER